MQNGAVDLSCQRYIYFLVITEADTLKSIQPAFSKQQYRQKWIECADCNPLRLMTAIIVCSPFY